MVIILKLIWMTLSTMSCYLYFSATSPGERAVAFVATAFNLCCMAETVFRSKDKNVNK